MYQTNHPIGARARAHTHTHIYILSLVTRYRPNTPLALLLPLIQCYIQRHNTYGIYGGVYRKKPRFHIVLTNIIMNKVNKLFITNSQMH